ncbi:restriction endonuclease [Clostridium perfringens]|uniref:restriction endonuclease n=1 Tax=Clostridium perfringens TaxID=1502 RepID=UPI0028536B5B|nr:restriction endonuclease [Clostridium perfringens]EIW6613686.1 restriction endonuclease [Clostridium perfringens]CAJ1611453.1 hypothetical protein CLO5623_02943 [Clostridium perfringens]
MRELILLLIFTIIFYTVYFGIGYLKNKITYKDREERKREHDLMLEETDLDDLDDRDFEIFCAEVFKKQGFKVFLTQETGDYGRDLIINDNIYVECKKFDENNSVGRPILQKLLGAMDMFNIEKGIVITTGKYSNTAKEAAKMSGKLILWDSKDLFKFLMADKKKAQKMVLG